MLAGVGKLLSNVKSFYNDINPATLTGAIDVVVVEQPDGSYVSSPFHVRFGKLGVIRSKQHVVYIEINGEPTELQMKLGPAGEAFFVQGVHDPWEGPDYMATSPIATSPLAEAAALEKSKTERGLSSKLSKKAQQKRTRRETEMSSSSSSSASDLSTVANKKDLRFVPITQQDDELLESGGMFDIEVDQENPMQVPDIPMGLTKTVSLPLIQESSIRRTRTWAISSYQKSREFHPFSDTDITPLVSPVGSRPGTPKSDTEYEVGERKDAVIIADDQLEQWNWGELPASSKKIAENLITQASEADTPQDKTTATQDAQSSGLWSFMKFTKSVRHKPTEGGLYLDDLNPEDIDPEVAALYLTTHHKQDEDMPDKGTSTIINMPDDGIESGHGMSPPRSPNPVCRNIISPTSELGTMKEDCGVYGDVAMSLCGGHVDDYNNVAPELFEQYQVDFTAFCEKPAEMLQHSDLVVRIGAKYYNWYMAAPMIMSMMSFQQMLTEESQQALAKSAPTKKQKTAGRSSWWPFSRSAKPVADLEAAHGSNNSTPNGSPKKSAVRRVLEQQADRHSESGEDADDEKEKPVVTEALTVDTTSEPIKMPNEKCYVKTLRLTSDELERLKLHEGENEIEFSVTTAYQGTTRCAAHIYLWKHTDKIVISDIDGTITKSDVWGQLFPMVGKDWSQLGVTELYTKIANNGYRFVYLSARAIGQAQMTRDYLKSVKQGELTLPPGPVFLNPSSLINAFHKEVIEKKPEEFKISCMSDIKSLFSTEAALYAGFGNRVNDIYAYRAVGIPKSRMFLIDPSGKLKSDFSETFQSSYSHLSDVTDHYFPPLEEVDGESAFPAPAEFSDFTYWREPLPEISLELPE